MSTVFFLVILACLAVVQHWYVRNEKKGGVTDEGVLGIKPDAAGGAEDKIHSRGYRIKIRRALRRGAAAKAALTDDEAPDNVKSPDNKARAYKPVENRNAFRRQEASSYRPRKSATAAK